MSEDREIEQIRESREHALQHALSILGEHFDVVRIFCAAHNETLDASGTMDWASEGRGNYHGQYGMVREWVIREEERMRIKIRGEESEDKG